MLILLAANISPRLKYIWEQFVQVNALKAEYKLMTYSDYKVAPAESADLLIEYNDRQIYPQSLFLVRKELFITDEYCWLSGNLPIFKDSIAEYKGERHYDIFYNAFVHLSRLEEWQAEQRGRLIHSYSFNHPRKNKKIWQIPVVNYLFNELEERIKSKYPQVVFAYSDKPVIEFSHDVDYLKKTTQLRIKQGAFHFYNFIRFLFKLEFGRSLSSIISSLSFTLSSRNYWNFDKWQELEGALRIKPIYYIFAKVSPSGARGNVKRWLLEPSYDIATDVALKQQCKKLIGDGNKIGIHGSYFSAGREELFIREKNTLEKAIGCIVKNGRQHWLNYYETKTPFVYDKSGIEIDSTLGFNDISGFRSGIASGYNPYDHRNNRPFLFKEIPLVIMDSHIYDYAGGYNIDDFEWLLSCTRNIKKMEISLDWHQRGISPDYGWAVSYKEIAQGLIGQA